MNPEPDDKLEKLIHLELAKLPELQAPETLIPRVLEAIRSNASKPWWQRSWFNWPVGAKMTSIGFACCVLASILIGSAILWQNASGVAPLGMVAGWLTPFAVAGDIVSTLASAALVTLNWIGTLWLVLGLVIAFLMYVSCVGMGTICFRLALNTR